MIGTVGLAWLPWRRRLEWRRWEAPFAGGALLAILALIFAFSHAELPRPGEETDPVYLQTFLALWDYHRNAGVHRNGFGPILTKIILVIVVLGGWLWANRVRMREADDPGMAMVRILFVGSTVAFLLYAAFHAGRELSPTLVTVAMPGRFLNLPEAVAFPVLAGILVTRRRNPLALLGLAIFTAIPLAIIITNTNEQAMYWPHLLGVAIAAAVIGGLLLSRLAGRLDDRPAHLYRVAAALTASASVVRAIPAPALLVGLAIATAGTIATLPNPLVIEGDDAVFAAFVDRLDGVIALGDSVDATALLHIHRPLLLDPQTLDGVINVPRAIPRLAEVLSGVYGVDFFNPPPITRRRAGLIPGLTRVVWESRSPEDWCGLAEKHHLAAVIVTDSWKLRLRKLVRYGRLNEGLAVYGFTCR
ncbi:MAG: hypothetical protein H7840_07555 [Alphaproteobacteria bacterium]